MIDKMIAPMELNCPISREVFVNPVLCDDGFTYEKSFIEKWIQKNPVSPMLGSALDSIKLRENKAINFILKSYKGQKGRLVVKKKKKKITEEIKEELILHPIAKSKVDKALDFYYKSTLELKDCCTMMEEAYQLSPNNFDLLTNYANILRFSTQFDRAIVLIKQMKKLRSTSLIPKLMRVRITAERGDKETAAKMLNKILQNNRAEDYLLIEIRFLSYSFLSIGSRDLALTTVLNYLQIVPDDPRAVSHNIYLSLLQEKYSDVVIMSAKYLEKYKDDVSILFHQAKAYSKLDQKQEAVKIFTHIAYISVDKSVKAKALYESAIHKDSATHFNEVVKDLEESYINDPKEEADGYLAALYADKKMFDKADEWLTACAKRTDIMADNVYLGIKAQIYEEKEDYNSAIDCYIKLAEIDSANSMSYNNRIEEILNKQQNKKN